MKLKHLAKIDWIVSTVFIVIMIPFWVPAYVLQLLKKPFVWVLAWGEVLHHRLCNWLARQADEVKDGRICNPHHLRNCTAKQLYNLIISTGLTMNQTFRIGDKVRLKDGDGRTHIIKEIPWEYDLRGNRQFAIVIFEDNAAKGFISDDGYTDMIKIEEEQL